MFNSKENIPCYKLTGSVIDRLLFNITRDDKGSFKEIRYKIGNPKQRFCNILNKLFIYPAKNMTKDVYDNLENLGFSSNDIFTKIFKFAKKYSITFKVAARNIAQDCDVEYRHFRRGKTNNIMPGLTPALSHNSEDSEEDSASENYRCVGDLVKTKRDR